ncbi:MAG: hypothetical protein ACREXR_00380 [Gammaproteobacteria bacterium]
MATFRKDPEGRIDYKVDWEAWLGTDTIISAGASAGGTITASSVRIDSQTVSASVVHIIWLSAGTQNTEYQIRSKILTAAGRVNVRSFVVRVEQL